MNMIKIGPELTTSRDWNREKRRMQAEILTGRGPANTGHWSDGPVNAVNKVLGAFQLKQEDDRVKAADQKNNEALVEFLKGMQAKPWTNPDTEQVSEAPAGGLDGGMAALGNYADTDIARTLLPQLLMGKTQREYAESREPKFETVESPYGRGGVGQRNTRSGQIVNYQGPQTPKTDSDILEINQLVEAMGKFPEGDPRRDPYQARLTKITSATPAAEINLNPGEPKANEELGKAIGTRLATQLEGSDKAMTNLQTLSLMESAAAQLEQAGGSTGALAEPQAFASSLLQAANVDPASLGLPADAGPAQVLNSLGNKLTLGKIGGADGMPANNFSDADRKFIESTVPRLTDTPSAFKAKLFIDKRMAERSIQIGQTIDDMYSRGESASAMNAAISEIKKQPLFSDDEIANIRASSGNPDSTAPAYTTNKQQPPRVVRNPQTGKLEMQTAPQGYSNPLSGDSTESLNRRAWGN